MLYAGQPACVNLRTLHFESHVKMSAGSQLLTKKTGKLSQNVCIIDHHHVRNERVSLRLTSQLLSPRAEIKSGPNIIIDYNHN